MSVKQPVMNGAKHTIGVLCSLSNFWFGHVSTWRWWKMSMAAVEINNCSGCFMPDITSAVIELYTYRNH